MLLLDGNDKEEVSQFLIMLRFRALTNSNESDPVHGALQLNSSKT